MTKKTEVVIVGGGPAGAVCGAMLAKNGTKCMLFEKASHPRHHVGESMQPATFDILEEHFGLRETFAQQGYAHKFGAVYIWGQDREKWRILFDERLERVHQNMTEEELLASDFEKAWQVDRASFDKILFDTAVHQGVEVHENCPVQEVLFEGERCVGVRLESGERIEADYVIDASGQRCLIGNKMGWVETVDDLKSVAAYSYFEGAGGLEGALNRHVQYVVTVPQGWIWFIPISATVTSIGLVTSENRRFTEEEFLAILADAEIPFDDAKMVEVDGYCGVRYARDWSYACKRSSGDNFLLVGDAACFVDPILSGGVDFAIRGGANAAVAILEAKRTGSTSAPFRQYEKALRKEYLAYLRMARYWYGNNRSVDGFFWEAHKEVQQVSLSTPLRAFVYLTSGRYAADQHFKVFQKWQEETMFNALGVNRRELKEALRESKATR